jgi:cell division protein FtsB
MIKTQSTTHRPRTVSPKALLLGIVALVLFSLLLSSVLELTGKYRTIRGHITELKEEQVTLKQKEHTVTSMNTYINTPEGQEQIFRDKYRMIKPGEGIIVVTEESDTPTVDMNRKGKAAHIWQVIMQGLGLR